mgnify:CR=1 FL=1
MAKAKAGLSIGAEMSPSSLPLPVPYWPPEAVREPARDASSRSHDLEGLLAQCVADRMVADYETFLKLAPKAPEAPSVQQLLASFR